MKIMGRAWAGLKKWWPSIAIAVLAAVVTYVLFLLGYEDTKIDNPRPRGEIIRNYGLLIVAFWGAALAVWRSQIASQQVESVLRQAETASRQAETSERGLSDGRFQKGADMLSSGYLVTRMGGIYTLGHLAKEHSDSYYRDQVIKLLATFVRHPVLDDKIEKIIQEEKAQSKLTGRDFREDVWQAVCIIGGLNSNEIPANAKPNLNHSNLNDMYFKDMDFSGIHFMGAQLKRARLRGHSSLIKARLIDCNLSNAKLTNCDLTDARIMHSDCTGSNFSFSSLAGVKLGYSNVSDADFSETKELCQEQLDQACQKPDAPPPRNIPSDLNWDKDAAIERWRDWQELKKLISSDEPTAD